MQNSSILQLIKNAYGGFFDSGGDLTSLSNAATALRVPSSNCSTIVNLTSVHRFGNYLTNSADVTSAMYDTICDMQDIAARYPQGPAGESSFLADEDIDQMLGLMECILSQCGDSHESAEAYINDVEAQVLEGNLYSIDGLSPSVTVYRTGESSPGFHITGFVDISVSYYAREGGERWMYFNPSTYNRPLGVGMLPNGKFFSIESAASACTESIATNECVQSLIEASSTTGKIVVADAIAILSLYDTSPAIASMRETIVRAGQMDSLSVLALVGQMYKNHNGSYNPGDSQFTPVADPNYSRNIIGVAVSLLVTTITAILTIVFRVLGGIIAVVVYVVSTLIDWFKSNVNLTHSTIENDSDLPAFNLPLVTLTINATQAQWNLVDEWGAVAIDRADCPVLGWLIPGSSGSGFERPVTLQVFLRPQLNATGTTFISFRDTGTGDPSQRLNSITFHAGDSTHYSTPVYNSTDKAYLTYSAASLERAATASFFNLLSVLGKFSFERLPSGTTIDIPSTILMDYAADLTESTLSSIVYRSLSEQTTYSLTMCAAFVLLMNACRSHDIWKRTNPSSSDYYDLSSSDFTFASGSYDIVYKWVHDYSRDSSTHYFMSVVFPDVLRRYMLHYVDTDWCIGAQLAAPNVSWPSLSRGSLMSAVLVSAIAASVTAGTCFLIKRARKIRAVRRIALREQQFAGAQTAFNNNASKENSKALAKANRRLGKAWTKAARAGVTSYNGFDTGSGSIPIADAAASLIPSVNSEDTDVTLDNVLLIKKTVGQS